jgi:hypothetical protein
VEEWGRGEGCSHVERGLGMVEGVLVGVLEL